MTGPSKSKSEDLLFLLRFQSGLVLISLVCAHPHAGAPTRTCTCTHTNTHAHTQTQAQSQRLNVLSCLALVFFYSFKSLLAPITTNCLSLSFSIILFLPLSLSLFPSLSFLISFSSTQSQIEDGRSSASAPENPLFCVRPMVARPERCWAHWAAGRCLNCLSCNLKPAKKVGGAS